MFSKARQLSLSHLGAIPTNSLETARTQKTELRNALEKSKTCGTRESTEAAKDASLLFCQRRLRGLRTDPRDSAKSTQPYADFKSSGNLWKRPQGNGYA